MNDFALDLNLFGFNSWGIGAYLEPDGWDVINAMQRPKAASYANNTPRAVQLAECLYRTIGEKQRWGHQLPHGAWTTYTEGEPKGRFFIKKLSSPYQPYFVEPPAKAMAQRDVLKHLLGRTCALGSTDDPVLYTEGSGLFPWRNKVSSIRLDIDQDEAWLYEKGEDILGELRDQRRIVEAMGLPYTAFKTGGRGFQAVIPLPCPLEPSVASLLSRGLRLALRSRINPRKVHVDRDGFDGLLRLPGGVHARGNTGLFIDIDKGKLFPLELQIEMIASCLRAGSLASCFESAEDELLKAATLNIVREDQVIPIIRRFPANPFSKMVLNAFKAAGVGVELAVSKRGNLRRELNNSAPLSSCDRSWADGAWSHVVQPGQWWEWVHMGGMRGMLAAVILFGAEYAEDWLLEKAVSHPAASRTDERERSATTRGLWKSFALKEYQPSKRKIFLAALQAPNAEIHSKAESIVAAAKAESGSSARWKPDRVSAILSIVLQAIADSVDGEVRLSLRDIEVLLDKHSPGQAATIPAIANCLRIICRIEGGVDYDTVLGERPQADTGSQPILEALVRIGSGSETPLFLPAMATYEWMMSRGLLRTVA